jgi:crotonobetainyl-CoA:carnitine CoA-transferase CaiB-like acyl-CoA transferase
MMKALEGIRVLELASVLAGPAVGMFFAEAGAEVIKVENRPHGGDMTRSWKLPTEEKSKRTSAYFSSVNYQKEHRMVDLGVKEELESIHELITHTDIVINNMRPSAVARFGLGYEELKSRRPDIILAELRGFLKDEGKTAFDIVLQAETGFISMTGSAGHPARLPVAFIDLMAAHQMKEAILMALYLRERDGKGAHITSSLEESALASLANQASNTLMCGHVPARMGTQHPNIAPYGELVRTNDSAEFVLAVGTQPQWQGLCRMLELELLIDDERFSDNPSRVIHRQALIQLIREKVAGMASKEFESACLEAGVPIGRCMTMDEVMETPAAKSMRRDEMIDGETTSRLSSIAFKMSRPDS